LAPVTTHSLNKHHAHLILTDQRYYSFPKHYHETYSVAILTDGLKHFRAGRTECTLHCANLVTMNPCEIHSGESLTEEGWQQIVLLFDENSADKFAEENGLDKLIFSKTEKDDAFLRNRLIKTYRDAVDSETEMEKEHSFETIMGLLFYKENAADIPVYHNISGIQRAVEAMTDEPQQKHNLNELAHKAGMSKYHFLRSFRKTVGLTPHAYLNMLRIERARRILLTTDNNIADIAAGCGFSDQAHFTRAYKKIYGTPPGSIIRK